MKVELTREDFNAIRMAIAVAKSSLGSGFKMDFEDLSDRLNVAWETAIEESVLERIERERMAVMTA